MRFWLGGYSTDMEGAASGIGELHAGDADSPLAAGELGFAGTVATADSPSWLTVHPAHAVVYAALEGHGAVQAFRRTEGSRLTRLGSPVAVGSLVCHLTVAPDGKMLVASCWGDGNVVRLSLDADGRPRAAVTAPPAVDPYAAAAPFADGDPSAPSVSSADLAASIGSGYAVSGIEFSRAPDVDLADAARALREAAGAEFAHLVPDIPQRAENVLDENTPDEDAAGAEARERVSRAHQSVFLPGGLIATTDMGFDLVRFWRDGTNGLRAVGAVRLPRGSGPRHMVWHPSGHLYVVTELSCEIFVLAPDEARAWRIVGGTQLSPETGAGRDLAAELAASADGVFLYAGVRGSNTIAAVRVRGAGEALSPVALVEAGVDWPRHHAVVRDTVLVAGQRSNEVAALTLDTRSGVPGRAQRRTEVPSPTCLLPAR
ncbi:beta-propeller fold lactonase family protein [Microbacterium sp. 18062]|uniref:lactonase family protein n=1 Tax=Microbacterium sp. 18062 TaxID=2681410 RepID=UPI00135C9AA1|nr:beta-propeller fold lactonase family protein [Microbacterium sp. 18062]